MDTESKPDVAEGVVAGNVMTDTFVDNVMTDTFVNNVMDVVVEGRLTGRIRGRM
jgi:hypothetical protein